MHLGSTNANTEYPKKMAFHYISATRYEYGSIKTNATRSSHLWTTSGCILWILLYKMNHVMTRLHFIMFQSLLISLNVSCIEGDALGGTIYIPSLWVINRLPQIYVRSCSPEWEAALMLNAFVSPEAYYQRVALQIHRTNAVLYSTFFICIMGAKLKRCHTTRQQIWHLWKLHQCKKNVTPVR